MIPEPDETYIAARNKLIFQADKHARNVIGPRPDNNDIAAEAWAGRFNLAYHSKMNELSVEAGLIAGGWYAV